MFINRVDEAIMYDDVETFKNIKMSVNQIEDFVY